MIFSRLPEVAQMKDITGKDWVVRREHGFTFMHLETPVDDPVIPALLEAFANIKGVEFWQERDDIYSKSNKLCLRINKEEDGSFISVLGYLQSLRQAYVGDANFLRFAEKQRLPRLDKILVDILKNGPSDIIEENKGSLKQAFDEALIRIKSDDRDLKIHKAGKRESELCSTDYQPPPSI